MERRPENFVVARKKHIKAKIERIALGQTARGAGEGTKNCGSVKFCIIKYAINGVPERVQPR